MKKDCRKKEKVTEPFNPLTSKDIEKAAKLVCEMAEEMGEPCDKKHIKNLLEKCADGKLPVLIAKNKGGDILGISAFICIPHPFNPDIMIAREFLWHAGRKLSNFDRVSLMKRLLDIMIATCQQQKISLCVDAPAYSCLSDMLIFEGFKIKNVLYVKEAE